MQRDARVLIVDPSMLFREGLRRIIEEAGFEPVWCSDTVPVDPIPTTPIDASPLLIVGSELDKAIIQIAAVKRLYPTCRLILLLEDGSSQSQVMAALRGGVNTVVLRRSSCDALIWALKLVLEGVTVLPSVLFDTLLSVQQTAVLDDCACDVKMMSESGCLPKQDTCGLSPRELAVLRWLLDGLPNKEIARRLSITEATVKVHVKAILRKAQVRNRTQIAMWASKLDLDLDQAPQLLNGWAPLAKPVALNVNPASVEHVL
jgi:two-component system nitrate/nitrite response regulator NarL